MKKDHLIHKGFIGSVHFSTDDEVFFGTIEGVPDVVTFEGKSVSELKQAFRQSVENYVALCKKHNKPALKSLKGSFNVRIKSELHQKAFTYAITNGITLNQFIQNTIEKELSTI